MKTVIITILLALRFLYPSTCIITEIDTETDLVTIATATGNEFQFYGVEDYANGDLVSVIFYDNGTETVTDDVIMDIRYSGTTEMFKEVGK